MKKPVATLKTHKNIGQRRAAPYPPLPVAASVSVLMAAGVLLCAEASAQMVPRVPPLPRIALPRAALPRTALPVGPLEGGAPQVLAGRFDPYRVNGNTATITQKDPAGILRWERFDIGADATVTIDQPSSTSVLLNRVDSGFDLNKTTIEGMLEAKGHVYIYNPNGIIFGKTATVNVNTLVATTLDISNGRFLEGILANTSADPIFAGAVPNPGVILVEGEEINGVVQRAALTAGTGGMILMMAPQVTNNGVLSAPDGQVVLAAGGKVLITKPVDANMRGLIVEVNNGNLDAADRETSLAKNDKLGKILVGSGNATMVGLAVNQMGRVSATTSVNLNGSIYLHARDGAFRSGTGDGEKVQFGDAAAGPLVLGAESVTEILPTLKDDTVAPNEPAFKKSKVDLTGKSIVLEGTGPGRGALIHAPGGEVAITARKNPGDAHELKVNGSRVDFAAGSLVDVSGSTGTQLAMASNIIEVELRGTELADNVLLRNSALRGKKVRIDVRKGTRIANVSGWLNLVQHNVGERTAAGGTVTVTSEGEIIQSKHSTINVSGGWVDFAAGYANTSKLISNGRLFDIGSAPTHLSYQGFIDLPDGARGAFEAGYREGKDAGTVTFSAPAMVMQGEMLGKAEVGQRQREAGASARALGGQLVIGSSDRVKALLAATTPPELGYAGKVTLGGAPAEGFPPLANQLALDMAVLSDAGISRVSINSDTDIEVVGPLSLKAGGELKLNAAGNVKFKAGITMPGGTLTATGAQIKADDGVTFDLAGRWSNDTTAGKPARDADGVPVGTVVLKGGALDFSGNQVEIGNRVAVDVSGGAWLDAKRKLTKGDAGSITLASKVSNSTTESIAGLQLGENLALTGYGLAKGAKLKLVGRNVTVGGPKADDLDHALDLAVLDNFFQRGGFSSYNIGANRDFKVASTAFIQPRALSWKFNSPNAYLSASSGAMSTIAAPVLLDLAGPYGARPATSVSFSASTGTVLKPGEPFISAGHLLFSAGARLETDPGAKVTLIGGRQLTINGKIDAPGGTILAGLEADGLFSAADAFPPERSIWFGSTAELLAMGSTKLIYTNAKGITSGEVLDGGSIQVAATDAGIPKMVDGKLTAALGYIVAEQGAKFDVSGALSEPLSFRFRRNVTAPQAVASAGGKIEMRAREGLLFDGELAGRALGPGARGGSLTMALDREQTSPDAPGSAFPQNERNFTLTASAPQGGIIPADLKAGEPIRGREGQGWLMTKSFGNGGFDRLEFKSQDLLSFDLSDGDGLSLKSLASMVFDAPTLRTIKPGDAGGTLSMKSAYVQIGSADVRYQKDASADLLKTGSAKLLVEATTVDLIGKSALDGFAEATIDAAEDIRLVGLPVAENIKPRLSIQLPSDPDLPSARGELVMQGKLKLKAAQIYPTTLSAFTLNAAGAGNTLTFESNGKSAQTPLSAGGTLEGKAERIVQAGRVVAPFGTIRLEAADDLTYAAGSVTSVAGEGMIPFGRVENGRDWLYEFGNNQSIVIKLDPGTGGGIAEKAIPQKAIVSHAPNISLEKGAVLDLSGGGELYSYGFSPGPGGSRDVLAMQATDTTPVFAINPNFKGSVAPRDWQYGKDGGLQPGDSVTLGGSGALAAGTYTLLPAHYALLPGGFSISAAPGTRDMAANSKIINPDGSMTVAGYRSVAGTGTGDARMSGYVVSSGAVVRTRSEYKDYSASKFFKDQAVQAEVAAPQLPVDGGRVAFAAVQSLALDGLVRLGAAPGGRSGSADISAPNIVVVADRGQDTGTAVKLVADDLTAMGADSLLLGGLRAFGADGTRVTVGAQSVTIKNNRDHVLIGPEIILVAHDKVLLEAGSVVKGEGRPGQDDGLASPKSRDLLIQGRGSVANGAGEMVPDTDGALLRVSGGTAVSVTREKPILARGTLDINSGATVVAAGSAYLDATFQNTLGGTLDLAKGGALGMGAPRISLGSDSPAADAGLRFDGAALATLSALTAIEFNSYRAIDLYGTVDLGGSATKKLTFKGAGFQGHGGTDVNPRQANFVADTVRFDNSGNIDVAAAPGTPAGALTVTARDIEFGNNAFAIRGYADTKLVARNEARAVGKAGALSADQDLTLAAGRIVTTHGADAAVSAAGKLALTQLAAAEAAVGLQQLGGQLTFEGDTIASTALIRTPAGQVRFTAKNGIDISAGEIYAGGAAVAFGSTTAYAPGGSITLDGGAGTVALGKDATLDVSATGQSAGLLTVKSIDPIGGSGGAILDGTIKGGALAAADGTVPDQGQFVMDVDQVSTSEQFGALNSKLNAAGFTQSRRFRVRNADVELNAGDKITAHETVIAADNGGIRIGGMIDARGAKGGSIELYASQALASGTSGNVTLASTAELDASAKFEAGAGAGSAGDGGRVVIGTGSADGLTPTGGGSRITLDNGARINVAGKGGSVTLRAPRIGTDAGNDVAIADADLNTIVAPGAKTVIEAYKVYAATKISSDDEDPGVNLNVADTNGVARGTMFDESNTFYDSAKDVIPLRLGSNIRLRPAVEVRSAGDLEVSVNEDVTTAKANQRGWNLNAWRYGADPDALFGGEPGVLTLRAAGNLTINGSISDGFKAGTGSMPNWLLDPLKGDSWSYRMAGGADLAAAHPLAVANPLDLIAGGMTGDMAVKFFREDTSGKDQGVAMVRTGTGRIDIAAGHDVILGKIGEGDELLGATVYTAGRLSTLPEEFTAPKNEANSRYAKNASKTEAQFSEDGGAITIRAAHDVTGAPVNQLINNWLFRQGRSDPKDDTVFAKDTQSKYMGTAWWSRFDYFNQGVATLAGGDISVIAETGGVNDLSASVATNAYTPGANVGGLLVEKGGGDLTVRAGSDISGGSFYVQKGAASIRTDGAIRRSEQPLTDDSPRMPVLALGDAAVDVIAGRGIEIGAAFNPTLTVQATPNTPKNISSGAPGTSQFSAYSTYGDDSAVRLTAISGDVRLSSTIFALALAGGAAIDDKAQLDEGFKGLYDLMPGKVRIAALAGDISVQKRLALMPSASGQLELLAAGSVLLHDPAHSAVNGIFMLDNDPKLFSPFSAPRVFNAFDFAMLNGAAAGLAAHTSGGLHRAVASQPVRLIAVAGDIIGDFIGGNSGNIVLPKNAEILAGRDIRDLNLTVQHLNAADVTSVVAGRDFIQTTDAVSPSQVSVVVGGPGRIDFTTGRNFDLGNSKGVVTRGNIDNAFLPDTGASINILAGTNTADYAGFARNHVAVSELSAADQKAVVAYMLGLKATNLSADITAAAAWDEFQKLPDGQRSAFLETRKPELNDLFFAKLFTLAGASKTDGFGALDGMIASLYPTAAKGDINIFGSGMKTELGGSIDLFAPGGSIFAGLVSVPPYIQSKLASELGVFTIRSGEVRSLVKDDFLVNQGRIFTLGGGDITLISQYGNIDAGRGSKTATSAPAPLFTTDAKGVTVFDISGSIAGSGIATLKTNPLKPAGDIYVAAPRGIFDAGDAGVRSSGAVFIEAAVVLNAQNISAAGAISGAPSVDSGGLGNIAAPANTGPKAEEMTKNLATPSQAASNTLSVDVLGYGVDCGDPKNAAATACADSDDTRKKN
jgi:filamentous hemagglutinin